MQSGEANRYLLRKIRISAFFDADDRANSASHDSNAARER